MGLPPRRPGSPSQTVPSGVPARTLPGVKVAASVPHPRGGVSGYCTTRRRRSTRGFRRALLRQAEQLAQRLEQGVAGRALVGLLGESADGAVQDLVLEEPEGPLDLGAVGVGEPAVEAV